MNTAAQLVAGFALGISIAAAVVSFAAWRERKRKGH